MNISKIQRDLTSLLSADEGAIVFDSNRAAMTILQDNGLKYPEWDEDEFCALLIRETVDWDQDGYWINARTLEEFLKEV